MSILFNGFVLGWSVAWPPGPVNAEIIRRGLLPKRDGGGFWAAWQVGLGACTGDFCWALGVAAGAGALLNKPGVRNVLGVISLTLLVFLAAMFCRAAWKSAHDLRSTNPTELPKNVRGQRGYLLGLLFALSSPWNIGFWLAVVGSQQTIMASPSLFHSLMLAGAVVLGAIAWTIVLCVAVRSGAHIFAKPMWQTLTQALTAMVMVYFAARLALQLFR
jgi:threonine/homoserine/homoserine lactone efflux protein